MEIIPYLILPAIVFMFTLAYASVQDLKYRKVPLETWYLAIIFGIPSAAVFFYNNHNFLLFPCLLSAGTYTLAKARFIGGADAYAFIIGAFLIPAFPFEPLWGYPTIKVFPVYWLLNAALLSLVILPVILIYQRIMNKPSWTKQGVPAMAFLCMGFTVTLFLGSIWCG